MCSSVCLRGGTETRLPVIGDVDMVEDHDPVLRSGASPLQAPVMAGAASAGAQEGAEHEANKQRACREQVGGPPPLRLAVAAEATRQHPQQTPVRLRPSRSVTVPMAGTLPRASSYMCRCAYTLLRCTDSRETFPVLLQMHVVIKSS